MSDSEAEDYVVEKVVDKRTRNGKVGQHKFECLLKHLFILIVTIAISWTIPNQ